LNLHLSDVAQAKLPQRLKCDFKEFAGRRVAHENRLDGLKLIFADGDWVLMRPSGTEPVVRIYTESGSIGAAQKLANQAREWITQ
jgi:phosphoglucomutase